MAKTQMKQDDIGSFLASAVEKLEAEDERDLTDEEVAVVEGRAEELCKILGIEDIDEDVLDKLLDELSNYLVTDELSGVVRLYERHQKKAKK